MSLSGLSFAVTPENGLWGIDAENTGQPGRGFKIDVQASTVVMTTYTYETNGQAQWYLGAGTLFNNSVTFELGKYIGGTPNGGVYRPATYVGSAGLATLTFSSATKGVITLPNEPPRAFSRFNFARPVVENSLDGTYKLDRVSVRFVPNGEYIDSLLEGSVSGIMRISGDAISQSVSTNYRGQALSSSISGRITSDLGAVIGILTTEGLSSAATLIRRGDDLVSMVVTPNFIEVDYWRRVSASSTASVVGRAGSSGDEGEDAPSHKGANAGAIPGGLLGSLITQ